MKYSKCRNIVILILICDWAQNRQICNILAHTHNVIETGRAISKLKIFQLLLLPDNDKIAKFSACQYSYIYSSFYIFGKGRHMYAINGHHNAENIYL